MKFCSKCVLPDSFPGITFDEEGVCSYCNQAHPPDDDKKIQYQQKFEELIENNRGKGSFDVITAYSGGKDSTYTLRLLAKEYGLSVLALTFDNGFISERAMSNITAMTDYCGATSMVIRPPFGKLKSVFTLAAEKDIFNPKTLDRASSICTTCIGIVKSLVLKTALKLEIPLVAYGWSPGQAPISSSIMKTSPKLQSFSNRSVRDRILNNCSEDLSLYFLSEDEMKIPADKWPVNIHPLAFFDYDEERILSAIRSWGWEKPSDTDPNSSNCTLNALANYIHREKYNFHPYAWEIAGIVRAGGLEREEGLRRTTEEETMKMVHFGEERLGINL